MENPSICIPRIFNTISRERIKKVFDAYNLGSIDNIDIHVGRDFQRVYIYFKQWHTTPCMKPRELLATAQIPDGGELRLYRRDTDFIIALGANELMSSRLSGSEEALATMALARIGKPRRPTMLM